MLIAPLPCTLTEIDRRGQSDRHSCSTEKKNRKSQDRVANIENEFDIEDVEGWITAGRIESRTIIRQRLVQDEKQVDTFLPCLTFEMR